MSEDYVYVKKYDIEGNYLDEDVALYADDQVFELEDNEVDLAGFVIIDQEEDFYIDEADYQNWLRL